ncbi:helix-turn-helix domain-containing protein [Paenibacillus sp. Marseille-Q4541]|uniref:helix-turn-helix transcriptional regulator n=1 Tax=Paenibacillus sp. Marseille-Q4541 TaxID=2831522 RepID=UPI001BA50BE0|nr:helix-turn-helix domain-containing protein [Paenibacillus sp. Marseille-Q4541]
MTKEQLIKLLSGKIKMIRAEMGYTQEQMAEVLGISKKTLVQIEKGRTKASWTTLVALVALHPDSLTIQSILGEEPMEIIEMAAHSILERPKGRTLGGKLWWAEIVREGDYILQQNMISMHYRILDIDHTRWYSTFDEEEALARLSDLSKSVDWDRRMNPDSKKTITL